VPIFGKTFVPMRRFSSAARHPRGTFTASASVVVMAISRPNPKISSPIA
jgi:hypothetical protein